MNIKIKCMIKNVPSENGTTNSILRTKELSKPIQLFIYAHIIMTHFNKFTCSLGFTPIQTDTMQNSPSFLTEQKCV